MQSHAESRSRQSSKTDRRSHRRDVKRSAKQSCSSQSNEAARHPTSQPVTSKPTATHSLRELLHVATLVFGLVESKTAGNEEVLHWLRVGERALTSAGNLLKEMRCVGPSTSL